MDTLLYFKVCRAGKSCAPSRKFCLYMFAMSLPYFWISIIKGLLVFYALPKIIKYDLIWSAINESPPSRLGFIYFHFLHRKASIWRLQSLACIDSRFRFCVLDGNWIAKQRESVRNNQLTLPFKPQSYIYSNFYIRHSVHERKVLPIERHSQRILWFR